ncbi:TPA: hypothetical protein ACX6MG_003443 [Photobacterium damselae]|uniref:hypothetical protein n=1 Tax=Photobacterium damselae TaxID=38293 RepID=UPI00311AD1A6
MRKIIYLFAMLSVFNVSASIEKIVEITAKIEKSKFYSYGVSDFRFKKDKVTLDFNKEQTKINDYHSSLLIETTIPKHELGFSYNVFATDLNSECSSVLDPSLIMYNDFATYLLESKKIKINEKIHFNKFNNICSGDFLCDELNFDINFIDTPINGEAIKCHGELSLVVGLDLI